MAWNWWISSHPNANVNRENRKINREHIFAAVVVSGETSTCPWKLRTELEHPFPEAIQEKRNIPPSIGKRNRGSGAEKKTRTLSSFFFPSARDWVFSTLIYVSLEPTETKCWFAEKRLRGARGGEKKTSSHKRPFRSLEGEVGTKFQTFSGK